jgi:RNA polymerase sigma factor (sigma-70 family)
MNAPSELIDATLLSEINEMLDDTEAISLADEPIRIAFSYANQRTDASRLASRYPPTARRRPNHPAPPDVLKLFLQDVARLPLIHGRADYTPLIRRIMCRVFCVPVSTDVEFPHRLYETAKTAVDDLNTTLDSRGLPPLDTAALGKQLESYFDGRDQLMPPALASSLGPLPDNVDDDAAWSHVEKGWRCLHLLALLPRHLRSLESESIDPISVASYAHTRLEEAEVARQQMLKGTLRYIISIAQGYIGRGVPYEDIVQDGFFGLSRSLVTFREYVGIHFQHYASVWIHQAISRAVVDNRGTIRVPVHAQENLRDFAARVEAHLDRTGTYPPVRDLITAEDDERAIRKLYRVYRQTQTPPLSLERSRLPQWSTLEPASSFADLLHTPETTFVDAVRMAVQRTIRAFLNEQLGERERDIIEARLGLRTGEEETLEQIGRRYGITRERVRQVEAKVHRKLAHPTWRYQLQDLHEISTLTISTDERRLDHMLAVGVEGHDLRWWSEEAPRERRRVERLTGQHVERARKGRSTPREGSRALVLESALRTLRRPAHFKEIYAKVIEYLGRKPLFDLKQAYATLFYSARFQAFGDGVFGLVSETSFMLGADGERVFTHCPNPLIPDNAHPRMLLESILRIIEQVKQQPSVTVRDLYAKMTQWPTGSAAKRPQAAFDMWYAAGIIRYVQYEQDKQAVIELDFPDPLAINALRRYCLRHVCRRIAKLDNLLVALSHLPRQSMADMRSLLFGGDDGSADLPLRLAVLAAFDALREEAGYWTVTTLGREVCGELGPVTLPDFITGSPQADVEPDGEALDDDWLDQFALFEYM